MSRESYRGYIAHAALDYLDAGDGTKHDRYARMYQVVVCIGKDGFSDRREAAGLAEERGMHAYECPVCGRWHLATQRK